MTTNPSESEPIDHPEVEVEELDIEAFAAAAHKPKAKSYRIRIDRPHYVVHESILTGSELLGVASKTPDRYRIWQVFSGGESREIGRDESVDLRHKGIEKFRTLARDQTEG